LELLKRIPNNSIDLIVTSPPYDNIRGYKGFTINLSGIGEELYRVMKGGGIVVTIMQVELAKKIRERRSFIKKIICV